MNTNSRIMKIMCEYSNDRYEEKSENKLLARDKLMKIGFTKMEAYDMLDEVEEWLNKEEDRL